MDPRRAYRGPPGRCRGARRHHRPDHGRPVRRVGRPGGCRRPARARARAPPPAGRLPRRRPRRGRRGRRGQVPPGPDPSRPAHPHDVHHRQPELARPRRRPLGLPGRRRRRHPGLRAHRRRRHPRTPWHRARRRGPSGRHQRLPPGLDPPNAAGPAQRGRPQPRPGRRPRRPHRRDAHRDRRLGHRRRRLRDAHPLGHPAQLRGRRRGAGGSRSCRRLGRGARRAALAAYGWCPTRGAAPAARWRRGEAGRARAHRRGRGGRSGDGRGLRVEPRQPADRAVDGRRQRGRRRVAGRPRAAGHLPRPPRSRSGGRPGPRGFLRGIGLPPRLRQPTHTARPRGPVGAARRRRGRHGHRCLGRAPGLPRPRVLRAGRGRPLRPRLSRLPALHEPDPALRRPRRPPRHPRVPGRGARRHLRRRRGRDDGAVHAHQRGSAYGVAGREPDAQVVVDGAARRGRARHRLPSAGDRGGAQGRVRHARPVARQRHGVDPRTTWSRVVHHR